MMKEAEEDEEIQCQKSGFSKSDLIACWNGYQEPRLVGGLSKLEKARKHSLLQPLEGT